jgi:hypothetical protein
MDSIGSDKIRPKLGEFDDLIVEFVDDRARNSSIVNAFVGLLRCHESESAVALAALGVMGVANGFVYNAWALLWIVAIVASFGAFAIWSVRNNGERKEKAGRGSNEP